MTRNEFTLLYTIKKHGILSCRKLSALSELSLGFISKTLKEFSADMEAHGYVKKRKNYGGYFFMGIGLKTNVPEDPFA